MRRSEQRDPKRGERIGKTVGTARTAYLYEHGQLTAELSASVESQSTAATSAPVRAEPVEAQFAHTPIARTPKAHTAITRQYIYLADQPIALIDTPQGAALAQADDASALRLIGRDIAVAASAWIAAISGPGEQLIWLHANHLGAIEAATDQHAQPMWQADYAAFGRVQIKPMHDASSDTSSDSAHDTANHTTHHAPAFTLNLRLPGQYEDAETGLHCNGQRYYDPGRGEYLTPDPLGTPDGANRYAYVNSNPLKYVDPSGLVLFAFDGTGNTNDAAWLAENGGSLSNVWRLFDLYRDGNARYVTGVGTVHRDPLYGDITAPFADAAVNRTGVARIDRMIRYFNDEAELATDDDAAMQVDIVGFSRGAAQSRDFANQIVEHTRDGRYRYAVTKADGTTQEKCQKVNFRFLGLWDTVLSTSSERAYALGIPEPFAYVAQAVALNEYRGDLIHPYTSVGKFPLESILQGQFSSPQVAGQTRIERGFLGSHSDIGGGFGADENQLAQVALAWMVKQATAAGITMGDAAALHSVINAPVLHDKSDSILTGAPAARAEDREVRYRDGSWVRQRDMIASGGMRYADTQGFISYLPVDDPARGRFVTGTVDMVEYLKWLDDPARGYNIGMTVAAP